MEVCIDAKDNNVHYSIAKRKDTNMKVIDYRGTSEGKDFLQDIQLFLDSSIVPVALSIFPFFTNECMALYSNVYSYFGTKAFPTGSLYFINMADCIFERVRDKDSTAEIIVFGHSLGGATANIIAGRKKVDSRTASPPGVSLGTKAFNFTTEDADSFMKSFIPERDLISNLGQNDGGKIVNIPCLEHSGMNCHSLVTTICLNAMYCREVEFTCLCYKKWKAWGEDCDKWSPSCLSFVESEFQGSCHRLRKLTSPSKCSLN